MTGPDQPDNTCSVKIEPSGPLGGYLTAPPSKNYTLRLVLGAALAEGRSVINNPAVNDDARALIQCCRAMGAGIKESGSQLVVTGVAGEPVPADKPLDPGNAGAVLRFLLGTACLVEGEVGFATRHRESLGRRPNRELLDALRQLGAEAEGTGVEGCLPIRIRGGRRRIHGGNVEIDASRSSQFLSSLLYLAPHLREDTTIRLARDSADRPGSLVSRPLVDQTLESSARFGIRVEADFQTMTFRVPGSQLHRAIETSVNADWPSTVALMSVVAVCGGMATIYGPVSDAQGERRAVACLEEMGCRFLSKKNHEWVIHSRGMLKAVEFNGDLATDAVPVLVGVACLAEGTSRFENIYNLRLKECNRIDEPLEELRKLGVECRSGEDWIEVTGRPTGYEGGVEVDSRGDHRVAQLLAIVGTRCTRGLTILRAEHITKSYPGFFGDLQQLGVRLTVNSS
jgi:3-phosphoshikimate 1-carboxyvinyltransferase